MKNRLFEERYSEEDERQDQQRKQYRELTEDKRGFSRESVNVIEKW